MHYLRRAATTLAAIWATAPVAAGAIEQGLLIDGELPAYHDMALSPGGAFIAAIYDAPAGSGVNVVHLPSHVSQRIVLSHAEGTITEVAWKGEDRLLLRVEQPNGSSLLIASDRSGAGMRVLMSGVGSLHDNLLSSLPEDSSAVLLTGVVYDEEVVHNSPALGDMNTVFRGESPFQLSHVALSTPTLKVFVADVVSGEVVALPSQQPVPRPAIAQLADSGGLLHFVVQKSDKNSARTLHVWHAEPRQWFPLIRLGEDASLRFVALDEAKNPLVLATDGRDTVGLSRFDLAKGRPTERLLEVVGADLTGPLRNLSDAEIIGYRYVMDRPFVAPATALAQRLAAGLASRYPHRDLAVISFDAARRLAVARIDHPALPSEFMLVATATGDVRPLTQDAASGVGRVTRALVPAGDGVDVPVTLILPPESTDTLPPLVVRPLGPLSSARTRDARVLMLTDAGYAVLNVITRGATGMGERLRRAGDGAYGTRTLDDVTAALAWARSSGKVDTARTAILGERFDADLALMAASRPGQPFTCAVALWPIVDFELYADRVVQRAGKPAKGEWKFLFGDVGGKRTREQSPVGRANALAAPTLISYVDGNPVGSYVRELQKLGKPVTVVALKTPTVAGAPGVTAQDALDATERFLDSCLE